jgi:predicted membrane protein
VHASLFSLLSSSKRRWGKTVFRAADTTAFMGGCELDLRDALMGTGELAVVDVFVLMGGVSIFVPPHWTVSNEVVPLMGGVHDKTHSVPSNPAQHLLVRGTVVMGGVEISN